MIIGIDASRALSPNPTGTERYSFEIIRHLLHAPGADAHHWRLYLPRAVSPDFFVLPGTIPAPTEFCVLPQTRLWTHRRLRSEVLRRKPDLLFVPAHVLPFTPFRTLPPTVVTVHDLGFYRFPDSHPLRMRLYLDWSTRYAARHATRLLAVSQATRRDLLSFTHASDAAIRVVHEAATPTPPVGDGEIAAVRAHYDLQQPYALFVGTLQPRKNLLRMAEAYVRLHARGEAEFDLVLAGSPGWLSSPMLEAIDSLGLGDRIRRTGYVPAEQMPALLGSARFLCYPSLWEGFGLPILEAQSAGVPVLTATNSSLPEVAGDGALLVDATDIDAIADAMLRLSRDETLCNQLIAAGTENVKRFSWEKAARETLAVLEEAARAARL
jgi:glycosyltransferase involved in cell wall biosynthesis